MIVPDSSVIIAAVSDWHERHAEADEALPDTAVAHAILESYSVLTRLPAPQRTAPADAGEVLRRRITKAIALAPEQAMALPERLASIGIFGGATYDALIAFTAEAHGATLISLDHRAAATYRRCGVVFRLL